MSSSIGDAPPNTRTVGDVALLPKVLDAASRFASRPSDETMDELAARRNLVPLFS